MWSQEADKSSCPKSWGGKVRKSWESQGFLGRQIMSSMTSSKGQSTGMQKMHMIELYHKQALLVK